MNCVKSEQRVEEVIKKSRFIGVLIPVSSEPEAQGKLKQLFEEYADATHIAYAYRIKSEQGLTYRFHDAGEPAGTAGKPIYQQLDGKHLVNALIAVIRYYGGVKLGAGGLTRAYGNSAKNVIRQAVLVPYVDWQTLHLTLDYNALQAFDYLLKKLEGHIVEQDFAEQVKVTVQLPASQVAGFRRSFPAAY